MDQEEVVSIVRVEFAMELEIHFFVILSLLLLAGDLDDAALSGWPLVALEGPGEGLVGGCDDLVQGKFNFSGKVVRLEVVWVVEVLDVVNDGLVVLTLLEVVLDLETLDPLWVHGVHDNLGLSELHPLVAALLVEHYHSVCSGERVQIWKVLASECQADYVDEACIVFNTLVGGCEHGIVQVSAHAHSACSRHHCTLVFVLPEACEVVAYGCCCVSHISMSRLMSYKNIIIK